MTQQDFFDRVKAENARSKEIYGSWHQYDREEQKLAIFSEYAEWRDAFRLGDINGTHGEIAELIQLANLCMRRVQVLTEEADA